MKLVKLLCLVILCLVIGNVVIANAAVDESIVIKGIDAEIANLSQDNVILKQQIATLGSLSHIQIKAEVMGFVENPQIVSLSHSSVALR